MPAFMIIDQVNARRTNHTAQTGQTIIFGDFSFYTE